MTEDKDKCSDPGRHGVRRYIIGPIFPSEGLSDGDDYDGRTSWFRECCVKCEGVTGYYELRDAVGPMTDYSEARWSVKAQTFVFPAGHLVGKTFAKKRR